MTGDASSAEQDLCDALRRIDTPTVSNAIEAFGVRDKTDGFASSDVRCAFPELGVLAGYAVTCTMDSTTGGPRRYSKIAELLDALSRAPKPAVVVCEYVGSDRLRGCFIGDVMAALFQRFGALGVVTDAPNRDLSGIRALSPGFHVFGAGSVASHGNGAILDVDIPVEVGGLRIRPGDIIHADLNGVISVPAAIASTIPEEAAEVLEMERGLRDMIADERTSTEAIRERFASRAKV